MPLTCYKIFGPSVNQLLSITITQDRFNQNVVNHQVAVTIYEDYIYRGSVIVALLISFVIIAANNTDD